MSKYNTPFVESELLLAAQNQDVDYMEDQLDEMSTTELDDLLEVLQWLQYRIRRKIRDKDLA